MARFILDVANLTEEEVDKVVSEVCSNLEYEGFPLVTIRCIDTSNDNQFHSDGSGTNVLTEAQINSHNTFCDL